MVLTHEAVISALMAAGSITGAAAALGVSRSTVRKRMKDPAFQALWSKERQAALDAVNGALQDTLSAAVRELRAVLNDPDAAPQVKLNASQIALTNALRYAETADILRRLDALERAQEDTQ